MATCLDKISTSIVIRRYVLTYLTYLLYKPLIFNHLRTSRLYVLTTYLTYLLAGGAGDFPPIGGRLITQNQTRS